MKASKLIAIDLDGTLLSDDGRLFGSVETYLRKLSELGHIIVLASGRPYRSMEGLYKRIGCHGPIICYNGADVFDPTNKDFPSLIYTFPKEIVKDFYKLTKDKATTFMCESPSTVYVNRIDSYLDRFFCYEGMDVKVGNIDEILDCDPMTCIIKSGHQYDEEFKEGCREFINQGIELHHWTSSFYSELAHQGANKGEALKLIAQTLHYEKEDIIAFGDADNDDGMLALAGQAFCMKNCKSQVLKDKYPSTEKSNNQGGVALQLAKIL